MRASTDLIVIHCSATEPDHDVSAKDIDEWHKSRGWSGIGYHFVIRRDGSLETGRDLSAVGAHVKGHNSTSVGICMIGGVDENNVPEQNFTHAQFGSLEKAVEFLTLLYPTASVKGHNELSSKACPSFDVQDWYYAS